jgi:hypothetical protein
MIAPLDCSCDTGNKDLRAQRDSVIGRAGGQPNRFSSLSGFGRQKSLNAGRWAAELSNMSGHTTVAMQVSTNPQ